jgi:hypothetical protein
MHNSGSRSAEGGFQLPILVETLFCELLCRPSIPLFPHERRDIFLTVSDIMGELSHINPKTAVGALLKVGFNCRI